MENNNQFNLQNIFICVLHKKEGDTGLEQHEGEYIFIFKSKRMNELMWINVVHWSIFIAPPTPHPLAPVLRPQKSFMKTTGITYSRCVLLRNLWYSDSNQTKGAALSNKSSGPYMSVPSPQALACVIYAFQLCTGTPPTQAKLRRQS